MTTAIESAARELIAKLEGMAINESHYGDLKAALQAQDAARAAHELTIEAAWTNYASDDIQIDDTPMVSVGEAGVWVSAWVLVPINNQE